MQLGHLICDGEAQSAAVALVPATIKPLEYALLLLVAESRSRVDHANLYLSLQFNQLKCDFAISRGVAQGVVQQVT